MTPEPLNVLVYPEVSAAGMLAKDATGQTVYAISASGLTVMKLSSPVDQMPFGHWPLARRGSAGRF